MTTMVRVSANGECYPAAVVKTDKDGNEVLNRTLCTESLDIHVGVGETLTVTEEYHEGGYKPEVAEKAPTE